MAEPLILIDGISPFFDARKTPVRSWSMPYSHMDLATPPYVDAGHLERAAERFLRYCDSVREMGYNGLIVGNLLHLTTLDKVPEGPEVIYGRRDPYRLRHRFYKAYFGRLIRAAHAKGLRVIVETDFPAWTPPLRDYLGPEGLSLDNPRLWQAYRAGVVELFEDLQVDGISVRIGEGGGAYDDPNSRYLSTVLIKTVPDAQKLIRELLSAVEGFNRRTDYRRTLLFRTWTIGLGAIGRLHTDPALYEAVFRPFYGRRDLLTVIKHVAMDFYDFVPRNATIGIGGLQQIVEFQARREFEGFNLFPNFRGASFAADIRFFTGKPQLAGVSIWSANGGFLFEAPTYYRCNGPDEWIDLNVFAYAQLVQHPEREVAGVLQEWLERQRLDDADRQIAARVLNHSSDVVRKAFYFEAYAKRAPGLFGLDSIPSMLWFWWTRPSTAYGVQSLIFREVAADVPEAIEEGRAAEKALKEMVAGAKSLSPSGFRNRLLESLDYEASVIRVLNSYRETFLNHYQWALTGDTRAYRDWRAALLGLKENCAAHLAAYRHSVHLPPLDLSDLARMIRDDERMVYLRPVAGLVSLLNVMALGWVWTSLGSGSWKRSFSTGLSVLVLCATSGAIFTIGYQGFLLAAAMAGYVFLAWIGASAILWLVWRGMADVPRERRPALSAAGLAAVVPLVLWQAVIMLVFAARGPVPIYWALANAVDRSWARRMLMGLLGMCLAALLAAAAKTARNSGSHSLVRRLGTLLAPALSLTVATVSLAILVSQSLPAVNDVLRIGPSVFGQAGPGVRELSSVSLGRSSPRRP
ncbi:MAG: hypothetical protein AB1898_06615 [Acidobacteriota bacterium]